jgi:hypothetical protein
MEICPSGLKSGIQPAQPRLVRGQGVESSTLLIQKWPGAGDVGGWAMNGYQIHLSDGSEGRLPCWVKLFYRNLFVFSPGGG